MGKTQYDALRNKLDSIGKKFIGRFELKNNPYIDKEYLENSYKSSIKQLNALDKRLYPSKAVYSELLIERSHSYRDQIENLYNCNMRLLEKREQEGLDMDGDDVLKQIVLDYFR